MVLQNEDAAGINPFTGLDSHQMLCKQRDRVKESKVRGRRGAPFESMIRYKDVTNDKKKL